MADQLVFIDTEFTNFQDPRLISIGLAASTGEEFYMEAPYSSVECSEFVREIVLPLLDGITLCMHEHLHLRLREWFAVVKSSDVITLCYDSEHDRLLFLEIFDNRPPPFIRFRDVSRHINEFLRYEFHIKNQLPEHNAINDALANRYAFRER